MEIIKSCPADRFAYFRRYDILLLLGKKENKMFQRMKIKDKEELKSILEKVEATSTDEGGFNWYVGIQGYELSFTMPDGSHYSVCNCNGKHDKEGMIKTAWHNLVRDYLPNVPNND
jgi:hypothetical protein